MPAFAIPVNPDIIPELLASPRFVDCTISRVDVEKSKFCVVVSTDNAESASFIISAIMSSVVERPDTPEAA